jgi:phage gpG-like protein
MPQGQSYYAWSSESNWAIVGVTEPMEYAYFTNLGYWTADDTADVGTPPELTFDQVTKFADAKYSWYGLSNQYNAMLLADCL